MRDYSHGKVRAEKIKDYESFRLQVSGKLKRITGHDIESWEFTPQQIRDVMQFDSQTAAQLLLHGTDWNHDIMPQGDR